MLLKTMKRRNTELTKNRKLLPKRSKYGDGSLGVSIFLAAKLLLIWLFIVGMDFITGFRVEYLYACWLMVHSVVDAYKYQGVGFTVFFISMVVTSDILVYMFLPTTLMFFAASLYVWIQLMANSGVERGVCVQTVVIWMVFLYLEATMRLRELKLDPSSSYFTWDICRPFAAHCVGYPLVTFSFSVKSFIGFKYRKHKQLQIASENRLFRDLINDALPEENRRPLPVELLPLDKVKGGPDSNGFAAVDILPNGSSIATPISHHPPAANPSTSSRHSESSSSRTTNQKRSKAPQIANSNSNAKSSFWPSDIFCLTPKSDPDQVSTSSSSAASSLADSEPREPVEPYSRQTKKQQQQQNLNLEIDNCDRDSVESEKAFRHLGGSRAAKTGGGTRSISPSVQKAAGSLLHTATYEKESVSGNIGGGAPPVAAGGRKSQKGSSGLDLSPKQDDLYFSRLEGDLKRLRTDLQGSRTVEQDLRSQLSTLQSTDKSSRSELVKLQQDNESLQQRLSNLLAARQQDKLAAAAAEKRLAEEKKARLLADSQLALEKKQRKAMEDAVPECSAACRQQRKDLDSELKQLRKEVVHKDEKMRSQGDEIHSMKLRKDAAKDADMLSTALTSLQDKNAHLENSLGQETKLKLDLFSALGEAKRQLALSQDTTNQRDKEIGELKQKISRLAEVMTLLPSGGGNLASQSAISQFVAEALKHQGASGGGSSSPNNCLNLSSNNNNNNSNGNGNGHRGMSPTENHNY